MLNKPDVIAPSKSPPVGETLAARKADAYVRFGSLCVRKVSPTGGDLEGAIRRAGRGAR